MSEHMYSLGPDFDSVSTMVDVFEPEGMILVSIECQANIQVVTQIEAMLLLMCKFGEWSTIRCLTL